MKPFSTYTETAYRVSAVAPKPHRPITISGWLVEYDSDKSNASSDSAYTTIGPQFDTSSIPPAPRLRTIPLPCDDDCVACRGEVGLPSRPVTRLDYPLDETAEGDVEGSVLFR